jgi:signal transduction histidine kinase/CheY-like chemotaxis protein
MEVIGKIAGRMISNEISLLKEETRIVAAQIQGAAAEDTTEIMRTAAEKSRIRDMAILDNRGRVIYYGKPLLQDDEYLTNPYIQRAFRGETVLGNPVKDPSGELVIRIWTPIGDDRVLVAILPGLFFSNIVAEFRIWETGGIFILDDRGTFVGHRYSELVLQGYNYIEMGKIDPTRESAGRFYETMLQGGSGIGYYIFNGRERLCTYMPIEGSDGFVLGVAAPMQESPLAQLQQVLLIASGIFLGLGILAAFLTANSIARPFEQINEQNTRLAELKRNAESASETKTQFLANMSHEMRTPLNAIIGLSELELGSGELLENTYNNLEKIYISGMTLLGIINDILDISKIESGKFTLISAEYSVASVINDTITLNIVRIGSKPIEFHLHIDETIPERLIGDELRVKQIFNNLLSNAFKYTREGHVDWYISTEVNGDTVWLSSRIQDTGIGIKEEDMSKLFTDYNQVDTKSNRKIEGTGLGLSITKKMVEAMNGSITVESGYGKGSVFSIRISQCRVGNTTIGKEVAENLTRFHFTAQRRTANDKLLRSYMPYATVLVVDDVAVNLDVAKGMLKPYSMTVECVTSGQKAIDLIREAKVKYDAIFMDHMMPGMDGIEAVQIIRNEIGTEYARTVPIIAFTANAIVGNDELFLQNGFQAFLSKPIDIMRLDIIINQWVRNRELEKDLPPRQTIPDAADSLLRLSPKLKAAGVDFDRGLRLFGDQQSYLDVLRSFITHTPAMLDTIREPGPLPEYGAVFHSIKGAAYGICADSVGKRAEELEHAAKMGDSDFVGSHNASFVALAEKLIGELGGCLKSAEALQSKPLKEAPDKALLAKALEASIQYDIDELDRVITELEQYNYESQPELVSWLREQGRKSEFEEIQKKLSGDSVQK